GSVDQVTQNFVFVAVAIETTRKERRERKGPVVRTGDSEEHSIGFPLLPSTSRHLPVTVITTVLTTRSGKDLSLSYRPTGHFALVSDINNGQHRNQRTEQCRRGRSSGKDACGSPKATSPSSIPYCIISPASPGA